MSTSLSGPPAPVALMSMTAGAAQRSPGSFRLGLGRRYGWDVMVAKFAIMASRGTSVPACRQLLPPEVDAVDVA